MIRLRTDINRDQFMLRGTLERFTTGDQIRSWPTHRILHHICKERRQNQTDEQPEHRHVGFMNPRLENGSPENQDEQRKKPSVGNIPIWRQLSISL